MTQDDAVFMVVYISLVTTGFATARGSSASGAHVRTRGQLLFAEKIRRTVATRRRCALRRRASLPYLSIRTGGASTLRTSDVSWASGTTRATLVARDNL